MAEKRIAIIGAGIAGLSAGCFARMNGFDVDVFESHDKPGGMCTSWTRKGYVFDYCIHNLAGTSPMSGLNRVWRELGALDGVAVVNRDEFVTVEGTAGEALHWYNDCDRLRAHIRDLSPEDGRTIDDLVGAARRVQKADLFGAQLGGTKSMLRVLPHLPVIRRWSGITAGEYGRRFRSPFLRRALPHVMYDIPGDSLPMMPIVLFLAGFDRGDLGWPVGGSLPFSRALETRFLHLGGRVHYSSPVRRIVVDNNRATGIRMADGTEVRADVVVSAADGYSTIHGMLNGRYRTEAIDAYYASVGDTGPFGLVVFLGLNRSLPDAPHALTLLFDEPVDVGGLTQDSLHVSTFGHDTGLAPQGKMVLKVEVQASYSYWKQRRGSDLMAYRDEKMRVAGRIIERIAPRFPGLAGMIDVMDVCTPATVKRYTGNHNGWQAGPPPEEYAGQVQRKGLSTTLPGLECFYHVGQWATASVGLSSAAISGRNMVRNLCKTEGKRFVSGATG